jgi:hypothetical protein
VQELDAAGDDKQKREVLATIALYLAHTCPTESYSCCTSKTMIERERQQHFDIRRVYLFMMIDAEGGVEVNLFDQDWFDGDDWVLTKDLTTTSWASCSIGLPRST